MNSKRIISLILSIVMTLQIFVFQTPVHAMEGANPIIQKSEGQKTSERTEEFAFKNPRNQKLSWFSGGRSSLFGARSVSTTRTETLKITTTATGLDEGDKTFNWEAFGQNKKFKAWINVAYVEDRKPGETVATERHKVSEDFEISSVGDINATVTLDASKTVDYYFLKTEYDTDDAAFKINAILQYTGSLSPKKTNNLVFNVDIYQIVSTKITYNLIDEYGKAIDLNDAKEEKPADTDLQGLGKIGKDISFDLKNTGEEILWQEKGLDEWDLMDSSLALSLTKDQVTSGGIDYKLSSTYDILDGGKVTIQRQKDVVTPKDPKNPGNIPEGYARLNLSADALAGGPTGTFNKDDDKDNRRVVDVKAGKAYTTAQAEVDKVTKPFPLTSEKKVDTGKTFDKWTPELGKLGTAVAKETKTLNATYKSSDEDIIPYLPSENEPKVDKNGDPIPTNYLTVTFKSEDATKGKIKIYDKEGATVLAKVKPGIDLSKKGEITTVPETDYGFTKWDPALGVVNEGQTYTFTAYFIKSGSEINEGDPIPKGWYKVTVSQDEDSIKSGTVTKAVYAVKPNDKLGQDKFADVSKAANDGYKDPAWYVGSDKLDKPYEKEITTSTDFIARATEEIANKFKTNGLKAVDITAYKGDKIEGKFWNKGVTVQREDAVLERLIAEATVTDTTNPARTTEKAGTFPGTLKVTFTDGSSLEVNNQKLIVIDTKVDINYDQEADKDAKAPRHKDEVVKGTIDSKETLEGAKVEILDSENNVIGITLAKADGSFIAGTRELKAGETIKVRVTLPKADKASPAVEKVIGLNPDELNSILPTADKLLGNLKGKPGISKDKLDKLEEVIKAGKALIDEKTKKAAATVPVTDKGQEQLGTAYANIKKAMEDLMENKIPMINGPDHKEIFVGDDIDLDKDIKVVDDNIKKQADGKDYSYKIYDASGAEVEKAAMVAKDGVYRVVYSAEDAQGVKASHTMTIVVKKTVVEVPGDFPENTPDGYVKVEFKSGDNAGLNGVSKFLVKKDAPKNEVKEPTIIPKEGYKVAEPKWSKEIPDTFANNFETTAQVLAKATTDKPADKDKDKYVTLTFEAGDHGKFEDKAQTTIYVLKNEEVKFNAPKIEANEGFTFAKWEPELKTSYETNTKHVAQYASNSDISDVPVKDFQEVKFVSGTDGNFGKNGETPITTKSFWVRPGKLVDLRTKAPEVTVTTTGKSFVGWDKDLVQTFAKAQDPTVINAKYDDTVKTTKPTENVDKYAKVDFLAGNLGTIAADATKTYWVVKDAEVTLTPPTVTAKDGWKVKVEKPWDPAVATKYTQDTIHVAQYEYDGASVVPQKPGDEKPNLPDKFVKVEFKKGAHGVISSEENFIYWVDPTKEVEITAPAVIADTNYKHDGWKNDDTVVDLTKANKFEKATDIVAQYKATVVTKDPNDANYVTVEFNAKEHGTLTGDAKFWVYKNEKVSITAPKVTAKDGYTFDKWDPAVKDSYAEATVHNATYTTNNNVSDTEVEGYNKVTFKAGEHGTLTEKSVWVKPNTLVDLTDKAPVVTANEGYSHIGWKPSLVGKFKNNTDIVAQYSNNISDKPVEGWTELTFDQGDHGKFAKGAKNVKWVNPKADLKLKDIVPAIVADTNYSLDGWKDGETKVDLETAKKFETAKTFVATYKSNVLGKDEHEKLPEDEKKNFVQITFNEGDHGKFPKEAVKEVYVKKEVEVDLTEKAPTVIPNQGYGHSGWEPALKGTFSTATTIKAQYKEGTFDENAIKEIIVLGPTKMGYGEGEKLDLTGLKIIAKDDAGLQKTYEGVDAITKAGFTIAPANETVLNKKDHDGQPIKVSKGEGNDKVTGQTETTLTIHENKSAKAEDVKALNQNKVVDGKVTNEPKDTTTVTGKVTPGSTVVIKDKTGKDITPQDITVDENGNFKAEVEKQTDGDKVQVIATEKGKQPSDPADAIVVRDANNNGIDDNKEDFDIKKADKIEVIHDPHKMNYHLDKGVESVKLDTNGMVVRITDTAGNEKTYTAEELAKDTTNFTVEPANGSDIGEAANGTKIKVTLKTAPDTMNPKSAETVQALKVTKTLPAPEVDDVKKGDTTVNVTVPKNGETKITVKVGDKEVVAEKDPKDGQWKVGNNPVDTVKGKLQIPVDELKQGDVVKVTTEDPAGNKGVTEKKVPVDEYSAKPTDVNAKNEPATPNKTTITGKATKGATITIKDKDGKVLTTEPSPIIVGEDGNFKATIDKKDPNTLLLVSAKEEGKEPSKDAPVQVEGSSDVVPVDPGKGGKDKPEGFVTVTFAIKDADKAKGSLEGGTAYYVNPKVDVQLNPPKFKAETGFKLDGWDQAGKLILDAKKYTVDTTINAVIGEVADVVPSKDPNTGKENEKPAGYIEIAFAIDKSKGKFEDKAETKFFVNPKKEIKLTAPEVAVTDLTYTFEGWDNANWNGNEFNAAKYETDTLITAKLKGSIVKAPKVGDVTTGDTKVDVNPGSADKVTVVVEGQGTVVVTKDPKDGKWKTPDNKVVTPDNDGKLPVPVQPIGEKALVEVTVEKDGVVSEKIAKTAQKILVVVADSLKLNDEAITVKTLPAGAKVTIKKGDVVVGEGYTDALGSITIGIKDSNGNVISIKEGDSFEITAEMDGYITKVISAGLQQVYN